MRNMDEVRAELSNVVKALKDGSMKPNVACEINNACGKVINTVKLELEYYALIRETPKIKFLQIEDKPEQPSLPQ